MSEKRLKKVYLEIGNICNLSCSFCPGTRREKRFMSLEEFRLAAERLRDYTDYLYFHLMGEPLLHPELERLLDIAAGFGYKVIITSNGTLLDKKGGALLESPAVHKINISLQSFEANGGGELENYVDACACFAAAAGERGKLCVLRLWNNNGLDSLNEEIRAVLHRHFPGEWRQSRRSLALAPKVFLEPGEKFDWPDMEAEGRNVHYCYGLKDQIGVLCDGTVVPCCLDHEGDNPLGNLFTDSLEDILSSARALAISQGFARRQAVEELCRRCGYAERFG